MNHGLPFLLAATQRIANRTHCSKGHAFTPENTILRKDGYGKRWCRICRNAATNRSAKKRGYRRSNATEAQVREFVQHIAHGGTFSDLMQNHTSSLKRPARLSIALVSIKQTLKLSPKLYARLRKQSHENYLRRASELRVAPAIIRRDPHDVLQALNRVIPFAYPERDDIIQQAALAVYEGKVSLAAACRNWQSYRRKHEPLFGIFSAVSLETPIGDSGFTLGQTIERGFYDSL